MIKCIVVDDEQPARELIAHHLSSLKEFVLLAAFDNAMDGFHFLHNNEVCSWIFKCLRLRGFS